MLTIGVPHLRINDQLGNSPAMSAAAPLLGLIKPNVTVAELRLHMARLPPEILADYGRRHFVLFTYVIAAFLGRDWVEKHMIAQTLGKAGATGYFQMEFGDDLSRETKSMRMYDLAEILMNLQLVEGFSECIERMKTGDADQVEATFAELQFAKLLYVHDIDFRLVVPEKTKGGKNYDFEFRLPSHPIVCADAKCKLETTDIDAESVRSSLDKARAQLPNDQPGIIYVKVPQHWFDRPEMSEALRKIATDFMRGTGRVVMVCYYISHLTMEPLNKRTMHRHAFQENQNSKTRFPYRDWRLFKNYTVPPEWDGMPPKWIRLMNFS